MIFPKVYLLQNEVFLMSYVHFMISGQTTVYNHRITIGSNNIFFWTFFTFSNSPSRPVLDERLFFQEGERRQILMDWGAASTAQENLAVTVENDLEFPIRELDWEVLLSMEVEIIAVWYISSWLGLQLLPKGGEMQQIGF